MFKSTLKKQPAPGDRLGLRVTLVVLLSLLSFAAARGQSTEEDDASGLFSGPRFKLHAPKKRLLPQKRPPVVRNPVKSSEGLLELPRERAPRKHRGTHAAWEDVRWPLTTGTVSSGFGIRFGQLHAGIDIAAPAGTSVLSAATGTVLQAGSRKGYGTTVIVEHEDGRFSLYGHLSQALVQAGQKVAPGCLLGRVGNTGHSTGPHLHFELRLPNGTPIDPLDVLPLPSTPGGAPARLSESQVAALARQVGFPEDVVPVMTCIAREESRWVTTAVGENTNGTLDTGLWQINDANHKLCGIKNRKQLFAPLLNAACARRVYEQQGLNAWVAYQRKTKECWSFKLAENFSPERKKR